VRFIGNSIGANAIAADGANPQAPRSSEFNVSALQVIFNRLDRRPEQGKPSVFDIALQQDLGVLARVPLASGLLSGKYKPGTTFPEGDVRARWKDPNLDAKLRQVQEISREEVPAGVDMATWGARVVSATSSGYSSHSRMQVRKADGADAKAATLLDLGSNFASK